MRPTCPHVDTPYTAWRLHILRRLFIDADTSTGPSLPFLYINPYGGSRNVRRTFHNSASKARNNVKDVRRSAKYKIAQLELSKHDGRRNEDAAASSNGFAIPTSKPQVRKKDASTWNPYEESSMQEIQDLVTDLRSMAKAAAKNDTAKEGVPFEGSVILKRKSLHQPESPLERRLPWDREKKSQEDKSDVDKRLANNVWARMLSSPLRLERGTKARLPRDLMVNWGAIRNPGDEKDYLLPIELSDLEGFREELRSTSGRNGSQVQQHDGEENDGPEPQPRASKSQYSPRVLIAPSRLLLEAMTDTFMIHKPAKKGETPQLGTNSAKINAALIPHRWRSKQEELKAFHKTRQKFYTALDRKPAADEPDMDSMAKLGDLQWQPDITERLGKIMRARVLIALEALGRDNQSKRAIHDRKVVALHLPTNGRFQMDIKGRILDLGPGDSSSGSGQKVVENEGNAPDWIHGAMFLHIGSPESFHTMTERWHNETPDMRTNMEWCTAPNTVPSTVAINDRFHLPIFNLESLLGHADVSKLEELIQENKTLTLDFWEQFNGDQKQKTGQNDATTGFKSDVGEPGTAATPLDAGEQVLSSIVTPKVNEAVLLSDLESDRETTKHSHSSTTITTTSSSYVILIKAKAKHADVLAREIWQLWRYVGGKRSGAATSS